MRFLLPEQCGAHSEALMLGVKRIGYAREARGRKTFPGRGSACGIGA